MLSSLFYFLTCLRFLLGYWCWIWLLIPYFWLWLLFQRDEEDMVEFVKNTPTEFREYYIQMQAAKRSQAPLPSQVKKNADALLCGSLMVLIYLMFLVVIINHLFDMWRWTMIASFSTGQLLIKCLSGKAVEGWLMTMCLTMFVLERHVLTLKLKMCSFVRKPVVFMVGNNSYWEY